MMEQGVKINNHYVPRGYLNFFVNNNKKIIFYDKELSKIVETTPSNIAFEKKLYTGEEKGQKICWEDFYTEVVDRSLPKTIKEIVSYAQCPVILKPLCINNIKEKLALIIVTQLLRTPERIFALKDEYVASIDEIDANLIETKTNLCHEEIVEKLNQYKSEDSYKGIVLRTINEPKRLIKFVTYMINKTWVLYHNITDTNFITSDNPVILYNYKNKSVGMCNGIGREDTWIFYPLTPNYMLYITPSNYAYGALTEVIGDMCVEVNEIYIIRNLNNYQFKNANRQIYGNNFKLVKDVLKRALM